MSTDQDEFENFVCITHKRKYPCRIPNEYHLISSWPIDVQKILDQPEDPRYYMHN